MGFFVVKNCSLHASQCKMAMISILETFRKMLTFMWVIFFKMKGLYIQILSSLSRWTVNCFSLLKWHTFKTVESKKEIPEHLPKQQVCKNFTFDKASWLLRWMILFYQGITFLQFHHVHRKLYKKLIVLKYWCLELFWKRMVSGQRD